MQALEELACCDGFTEAGDLDVVDVIRALVSRLTANDLDEVVLEGSLGGVAVDATERAELVEWNRCGVHENILRLTSGKRNSQFQGSFLSGKALDLGQCWTAGHEA